MGAEIIGFRFFFFGWRNCSHPKPAQGSAPGHRSITIDQSIIPINSAQNLDKKNCIDELKSSATDWARTVECILRHSWMHYAIILKFFDASFMNHKLWFSTKFTTLMSKLLEKKNRTKFCPFVLSLNEQTQRWLIVRLPITVRQIQKQRYTTHTHTVISHECNG